MRRSIYLFIYFWFQMIDTITKVVNQVELLSPLCVCFRFSFFFTFLTLLILITIILISNFVISLPFPLVKNMMKMRNNRHNNLKENFRFIFFVHFNRSIIIIMILIWMFSMIWLTLISVSNFQSDMIRIEFNEKSKIEILFFNYSCID